MAYAFRIRNLDKLTRRLEKYSETRQKAVDAEIGAGFKDAERLAKGYAPVNDGRLKGSIVAEPSRNGWRLTANTFYAPYVEFGTKGKTQVPPGLERYAAQFKGGSKRGNFKMLLEQIEDWVKKKRIKTVGGEKAQSVRGGRQNKVKRRAGSYRAAAYWIALSIVKNGIKPQPFFFRSWNRVRVEIFKNVAKAMKFR